MSSDCRFEALTKLLEEHTAAEVAAREAAEAANADLEATRQHAFELKVCCWANVTRFA